MVRYASELENDGIQKFIGAILAATTVLANDQVACKEYIDTQMKNNMTWGKVQFDTTFRELMVIIENAGKRYGISPIKMQVEADKLLKLYHVPASIQFVSPAMETMARDKKDNIVAFSHAIMKATLDRCDKSLQDKAKSVFVRGGEKMNNVQDYNSFMSTLSGIIQEAVEECHIPFYDFPAVFKELTEKYGIRDIGKM